MKKTLNIFSKLQSKKHINPPPYDYNFLISLSEEEYPIYLKKIFEYKMGYTLDLRNPKTFNEKIQWLKIYDNLPIKTTLTDKILVREWIKEKIGSQYLKPVLWIGNQFEEIPFEILPDRFYLKTNHGCKWHALIKDKKSFCNEEKLFNYVKMRFQGWLSQSFFGWSAFEQQYKNIKPQIFVEPVLFDKDNYPFDIEIYCFNGKPKIFQEIKYANTPLCCVFNENFENINLVLNSRFLLTQRQISSGLIKAVSLSRELAKEFKLVRIDWILYKDKLYFNEMTFTPYSGFFNLPNKKTERYLTKLLKL